MSCGHEAYYLTDLQKKDLRSTKPESSGLCNSLGLCYTPPLNVKKLTWLPKGFSVLVTLDIQG